MSAASSNVDEQALSGLARLWLYQKERFPIFQTALLVWFFTAATLCVSAQLSGRDLPPIWTFVGVWLAVLIIFFQMRACDEYKDLETDTRYRPERPIPRGLIKLKTVLWLALGLGLIAIAASFAISPRLLLPLGFVWLWLLIMTKEFFVAEWLISKPLLYLVSHMMIMPIIDLYVSAAEWIDYGTHPPTGLWIFLVLSFLNGCVLEFGRKIWTPENEREGVETYSKLLGSKKAASIWAGFCCVGAISLIAIALKLGAALWVAPLALAAVAFIFLTAQKFGKTPSPALQKRIDTLSGLWVLMCYALAGFVPLLVSHLAGS